MRSGQIFVDDLNLGTDQPLQHVLHARDDLIERNRLLRDHLLAAERQQLARQPRRTVGRLQDLFGIRAPRVVFVDALQEDFRVAVNRHQQVVEIVRDTAGEPADRFHFLRLAQLFVALLQRRPATVLRSVTSRTMAVNAVPSAPCSAASDNSVGKASAVLANTCHFDGVAERQIVGFGLWAEPPHSARDRLRRSAS